MVSFLCVLRMVSVKWCNTKNQNTQTNDYYMKHCSLIGFLWPLFQVVFRMPAELIYYREIHWQIWSRFAPAATVLFWDNSGQLRSLWTCVLSSSWHLECIFFYQYSQVFFTAGILWRYMLKKHTCKAYSLVSMMRQMKMKRKPIRKIEIRPSNFCIRGTLNFAWSAFSMTSRFEFRCNSV